MGIITPIPQKSCENEVRWYMSFLTSEPGSRAFSEQQQLGLDEVREVYCVELSPPSPLLLLNYYTRLGALGITKLRKAWSFLSRSRGSMRGEKMYVQVSQRWARCDDCLDRGRRDYSHPGTQRLCTWGMDERSAGRHWREGQFLERKAWPRPQRKNYAQGVLNGCDAGTWRQLRETGKRLVAALLYRSHTPSNGVQTVFGIK